MTYVVKGVESDVHFEAGDFRDRFFRKEKDGVFYRLRRPHDTQRAYTNANYWGVFSRDDNVNNDFGGYSTYGVRTDPDKSTHGQRHL